MGMVGEQVKVQRARSCDAPVILSHADEKKEAGPEDPAPSVERKT
jgi:hypothetical protein